MNKPIAIIAGDPNSISSEIIFKVWKLRNKYLHKPFFIIGSINLLKMQMKKLKYKIKIKKINNKFSNKDLNGTSLPVYDVYYTQKKPFENLSEKSSKYIFKCFEKALQLRKKNKLIGLINCPVSKEHLFKKKYQGVTEYLSTKTGINNISVMLIYNKNLSVAPMTTHIPLKQVSSQINKNQIIKKVYIIDKFYKKILKKKPKIGILGLNPHNYSHLKKSEERLISLAVKSLGKLNVKISGPIPPDTSFMKNKRKKYDVLVGMYHDQVLTPFKSLFDFNAINITLGLSYIRISPDHGVGKDILGAKKSNPKSLIESIKFFNNIS